MGAHLENARRFMEECGVDALLLTSRENKFYTAGLYSGSGYVLVTGDDLFAVVDGRYFQQQKERMEEGTALLSDGSGGPLDQIARIVEERGIASIGFEEEDVTYGGYRRLLDAFGSKLVPAAPDRMRRRKDEGELAMVRKACAIADQGYGYILTQIRAGMTERQVENQLLYYLKSIGAQKESFDIIVASGVNGSMPHAKAGDRAIQPGDFVTMDFGARVGEYCSDITRTVAVGRAEGPLCEVYDVVKRAQAIAIQSIRPGVRCWEVDRAAREAIGQAGYGAAFLHNLGHSMGIMCHEDPRFSRTDQTVLEPGMVMTVEPGIYLEGVGGVRIEDDILVTESGCEVLTKASRELTAVGRGG